MPLIYAMFHAVRSIFALDKIDFRQHSRIVEYFNDNFVKAGMLDNKFGKILKEAKGKREQSDYRVFFHASKKDAEIQLKNAKEFISEIEEFIKKKYIINQRTKNKKTS